MNWHPTADLDKMSFEPASIFAAGLHLHHISNTAYPIGHVTTMRPYKVPRSKVQETAPSAWGDIQQLGLYVHIPFCQARCGFCEYTVLDPKSNRANVQTYFDLLLREFELWKAAIDTPSKTLIGFDIGGGTPSFPNENNIGNIVTAARRCFNLPPEIVISIESTPRIAAKEPNKIKAYYQMGIQRISMGVQTINPQLLESVNRENTSIRYNFEAVEHIRKAGFQRFNVDVMYGLPGQSLASLEVTLKHVCELAPEYITLYRTRFKGTRLASETHKVSLQAVISQARLAKEYLTSNGYHGTNGKNTFSRLVGDPGTSDYLTQRVIHGTPYLGLGLGAQSLSHKTLSYNAGAADKRLVHYQRMIQSNRLPIQDLYHLSPEAAMGKMIAVSFYFGEINLQSFQNKFGVSLENAFPREIEYLLEENLMGYRNDNRNGGDTETTLRLTKKGEDNVNGVIALFYAGAIKNHLLKLSLSEPVLVI